MTKLFLAGCLLLCFALAASAQTNRCDEPQGDQALTVPNGTPTRVGFCHDLKDAAGTVIPQPVFIAMTNLGDAPLTVVEVGSPLPDGRRWFESNPIPATQSITFRIVAENAQGRSLPSTLLSLTVTATIPPAVPSPVLLPRILR